MVAAASPLLSGIVKSVPSGDTIVVMKQASPVNGPPPEMRLTLSSVRAPVLARDMRSDEPHAFAAREALRKRLIGRTVSFRIDYRVASLSRLFATVYPTPAASTPSVNMDMAELGHVRVRRPATPNEDVSPELDQLIDAEERAAAAGLGLHRSSSHSNPQPNGDDDIAKPRHVLPADDPALLEGQALVDACQYAQTVSGPVVGADGTGTEDAGDGPLVLHGVVEYVATGSILKAFVRDVPGVPGSKSSDRVLTLSLSGVQCPGFRRPEGAPADAPPKPMPFAQYARFLTEIRLLHRDVRLQLEGVDRNDMLFASVEDPAAKIYIGEELLRAGMAKTMSWSLDKSARAPALRAAEQIARKRQVGLWKGVTAPAATHERFTGKVVEVVSGDLVAIAPDDPAATASGRSASSTTIRRISLASVRVSRAERGATRDRAMLPTGPAADAKEALRRKLIGRRVFVKIEYTREPGPDALRKEVMVFATIQRENSNINSATSNPNDNDVALSLISSGLLSVVRHRGDEERATNYEQYLELEAKAVAAKKGMHNPNAQNGGVRINNLAGPDAKKRSRDVLAGLQRGGPYKGLVEHVTSASRYRVYLPTESMLITLALRAVRCPQPTRRVYEPDGSIREEVAGEPHGDESLDFARERIMQREVEVDISNVDRVGAFLGNITILGAAGGGGGGSGGTNAEKVDVSSLLLSSGHGYLHESFDPSRDRLGPSYTELEKKSREAKRGLWVDYVEPADGVGDGANSDFGAGNGTSGHSNGARGGSGGPLDVKRRFKGQVCDISYGGRMFVQDVSERSVAALNSIQRTLAELKLDGMAAPANMSALKPGDMVAAKFSVDQRWYRARVLYVHRRDIGGGQQEQLEKVIDVRFMDFGNEERTSLSCIRKLMAPPASLRVPPIATEVALAYLVIPDENDHCGQHAGETLRDLVFDRTVDVAVMSVDGPNKVVGDILIANPDAGDTSANSSSNGSTTNDSGMISVSHEMLKAGLARIVRTKKDRAARAAFNALRPYEEVAIRSRQFLWNYGEAFESDCDDNSGDNNP